MKILKCKICRGEVDIIGHEHSMIKKTKCRKCGFNNQPNDKSPEIIIIRKRSRED